MVERLEMICQLSFRSVTSVIQRVKMATSRGRWHQLPAKVGRGGGVGASLLSGLVATGLAAVLGAGPSNSYSNLLIRTGARPRARTISANEVSGIFPQDPSAAWPRTRRSAADLYQSKAPKYLKPLASPTRWAA